MNKEKIKDILDKFENDEYVDAKEILQQEIKQKTNDYLKDKLSLENESTLKDVPNEFMSDPLYKAVLTAKNEKEFKKALDTLLSIRGADAVKILQKSMKK